MDNKPLKIKDGEVFCPMTQPSAVVGLPTNVGNIPWATTRIENGAYYMYFFKSIEDYNIWAECEGCTTKEIYAKGYTLDEVSNAVLLKLKTGEVYSPGGTSDNTDSNPTSEFAQKTKLILYNGDPISLGNDNVFVTGETIPIQLTNCEDVGSLKISVDLTSYGSDTLEHLIQISYDGKNIEDSTKTWVDLCEHYRIAASSLGITGEDIESSRGNHWVPQETLAKLKRGEKVNLYLRCRTSPVAIEFANRYGWIYSSSGNKITITAYISSDEYITGSTETVCNKYSFYYGATSNGAISEITDKHTYLHTAPTSAINKRIMNNVDKPVYIMYFKGVNCNDAEMKVSFETASISALQDAFQFYIEGTEDTKYPINLRVPNSGNAAYQTVANFPITKEQARNGIHIYIEPKKNPDGTYNFPTESGTISYDLWGEDSITGNYVGFRNTITYEYILPGSYLSAGIVPNKNSLLLRAGRTPEGTPTSHWEKSPCLLFTADPDHLSSGTIDTTCFVEHSNNSHYHERYFYLEGDKVTSDVRIRHTYSKWKYEYIPGNPDSNSLSWKEYNKNTSPSELRSLLNQYHRVLFRITCIILGDTAVEEDDPVMEGGTYAEMFIDSVMHTVNITLLYDKTASWTYSMIPAASSSPAQLASNGNNSLYEWIERNARDLGIEVGNGYILNQELAKITTLPKNFMQDVYEDSEGNTLEELDLSALTGLKVIEEKAFNNCPNLESVTLPNTGDNIIMKERAFNNCHADLSLHAIDPDDIIGPYEVQTLNID